MIEVTLQGSRLELVALDGLTILRAHDGEMVFNIILDDEGRETLISELVYQKATAA